MVQLNISPTARQLGLPTSPGLLIISSAVRDAMDKVMAPVAKNISLLTESLHLLTGASGSSSSRHGGLAISTTTPPSARLRVGGQMARSPSPDFQGGDHRRIAPSALRVSATEVADTAYLVAASAREHLLQEGHIDNDEAVSLDCHDLSDTPRDNFTKFKEKFSNKELTGKPLLSTAADCFNSVYRENTSASDHALTLLKEELRPENVKLRVKPTNRAVYQLKHGARGAIRAQDKALQAAQEPLTKAMYRTMRVAEGISSHGYPLLEIKVAEVRRICILVNISRLF